MNFFSKRYIGINYKLFLKAKALAWFSMMMSCTVGVLFVLAYTKTGLTASSIVMLIHIGIYLIGLFLLWKGQYIVSAYMYGFLNPLVQIIRIFIDNYTAFYGLLASVSFLYFFMCAGYIFLPYRKALIAGSIAYAYILSALIIKGVFAGMTSLLAILFGFSAFVTLLLINIQALIETKVFKENEKKSIEIENNNTFLSNQRKMIEQLILQLSLSSKEIAGSSEYFAQSTQEESASIEEITSTIEELTATSDNVYTEMIVQNDKVRSVIEQIKIIHTILKNAEVEMSNVMKIKTSLDVMVDNTKNVIKQSMVSMNNTKITFSKVEESISVIDRIADQINLLALNAQIESARAGEAGRGFAVVADEIDKLAGQTQSNSKDILQYIKNLNNNMQGVSKSLDTVFDTVLQMIVHITEFGEGVINVGGLAKQDTDINKAIMKEAELISSIMDNLQSAVKEQQIAFEEVSKSITDMNNTVQTNAGTAEELASSAESLNHLAMDLQEKIK